MSALLDLLRRPVRPQVAAACPLSGREPTTLRIVHDGQAGCECCGRLVDVLAHPDGGPGGVYADHDREVL